MLCTKSDVTVWFTAKVTAVCPVLDLLEASFGRIDAMRKALVELFLGGRSRRVSRLFSLKVANVMTPSKAKITLT